MRDDGTVWGMASAVSLLSSCQRERGQEVTAAHKLVLVTQFALTNIHWVMVGTFY